MDSEKILRMLGGNAERLRDDYLKVSGVLKNLGLSEYEARAYVSLVAAGASSARSVADVAHVPRTSAYKILTSLERKGFVRSIEGRPRRFAPVDPTELSKRLVSVIEQSFGRLESIKNVLSERGVPQLVYTIMGKERVLDKIGEMLDKAEESFAISSPSVSEIRRALAKRFAAAISRGVRVLVITRPFVKVPKGADVRRREGLIATDIISDGRLALIAAADLSACGYTDNEALARHLEEFLRIMAESG